MARSKHFHVWSTSSSLRVWVCQKCHLVVSDEAMCSLFGGPFDAATMSKKEIEAEARKGDVARAMERAFG